MKRVYIQANLSDKTSIVLPEQTFHHLFRVLRCQTAERIVAFNGDGHDYHGTLALTSKKSATLIIEKSIKKDNESPLHTVLLQCLSKGERMDMAIQKAVELGVNEIYPVRSEYTTVKLDSSRAEKKQQHWQTIIHCACEQSGRAVIPIIHPLQPLESVLSEINTAHKIVLHPYTSKKAITPLPEKLESVAMLIGPEGGLSDNDMNIAEASGFSRLSLGKRILRTETGTVSALSLAQYLWGDWHV